MSKLIDNREFVVTWTRSNNATEVAKTLGCTYSGAYYKARALRKLGVNLKKFPRSGANASLTAIEVSQLNALIKKTAKG